CRATARAARARCGPPAPPPLGKPATRARRSPCAPPTRRRRGRSASWPPAYAGGSTSWLRSGPCRRSADPEDVPAVPPLIVPIFPLPDVTFFPNTLLPLHVFEARYRAMVMDVLARDRRLAVVKLVPGFEAAYAGKPAVHPVAGAGEIVSWERLATGRYNILIKGEWRIRIEGE